MSVPMPMPTQACSSHASTDRASHLLAGLQSAKVSDRVLNERRQLLNLNVTDFIGVDGFSLQELIGLL